MKPYLLIAAGKDRPGIVAAVTEVLFKHGCNLADTSMTRLGHEFASLLIFMAPKKIDAIERDLRKTADRFGLLWTLKELRPSEAKPASPKGHPAIISVSGADRPGIVYRVSRFLASKKINITDVSTHTTKGGRRDGYVMLFEAELPSKRAVSELKKSLERRAKDWGLHVSVRPVEIARL